MAASSMYPEAVQTGPIRTVGARSSPVRWKHAITVWLCMYPLNVLVTSGISLLPWWGDVTLPIRSIILVTVLVPLMTFLLVPLATAALRPWLRRSTRTARCERALISALDSRVVDGS